MKRILTIYLFLLLSSIGFGQTVVTKTGYCLLSETDADYQRAVDVALERAKTFAIMDVCGEDVSVFSISRYTDGKSSFTTNTNISTCGVVHVLEKSVDSDGKTVYVTMTGEVYRVLYPVALTVDGFDEVCDKNEELTFSISFRLPSFLKIFWFDQETGDGGILYDGNTGFDGSNYAIGFPINKWENYKKKICPFLMTQKDRVNEWSRTGSVPPSASAPTEATKKYVTILFVTTKSNVEFNNSTVTEETFMDWWCRLDKNDREIPVKKSLTINL